MFKKFARIFSRRHKQTTFPDAGFLGALRVKCLFVDWLFHRRRYHKLCHVIEALSGYLLYYYSVVVAKIELCSLSFNSV